MYTRRDWGREAVSVLFWICATLIAFFYLLFCAVVILAHFVPYIVDGIRKCWDWAMTPPAECEWRDK